MRLVTWVQDWLTRRWWPNGTSPVQPRHPDEIREDLERQAYVEMRLRQLEAMAREREVQGYLMADSAEQEPGDG